MERDRLDGTAGPGMRAKSGGGCQGTFARLGCALGHDRLQICADRPVSRPENRGIAPTPNEKALFFRGPDVQHDVRSQPGLLVREISPTNPGSARDHRVGEISALMGPVGLGTFFSAPAAPSTGVEFSSVRMRREFLSGYRSRRAASPRAHEAVSKLRSEGDIAHFAERL